MQNLLKKHNFIFKKRYGQNFIVDKNIIQKIIKLSKIDQETLVIEIGCGSGTLTSFLSEVSFAVLGYEIDRKLKDILIETVDLEKVTIIYDDFLKRNIKEDLLQIKNGYKKIYVIANLPYYITTPIIVKLIEENLEIEKMVLMVQKEVGDRLGAKVGTKDYNAVTVLINYFYNVKKIMFVNRTSFIPRPNVDSLIIELKRKNELLFLKDRELFSKLIKDSFQQKRKTIKNNLKDYNLNLIEEILKKHNLNLMTRAEQIPIFVFVEIANKLSGDKDD